MAPKILLNGKNSKWKSKVNHALNQVALSVIQEARITSRGGRFCWQGKMASEIAELRRKLKDYKPENIFNCDQTGLYYKMLPKRLYLMPEETVKLARGTKTMNLNDRLTVMVCTNATGTLCLPPALIGYAKTPRCFQDRRPPLPYFQQKKCVDGWQNFRSLVHAQFPSCGKDAHVRKKLRCSWTIARVMENL